MRNRFGSAYRMSQRAIRDHRHNLIRYFDSALVPPTEERGEGMPTEGTRAVQLFELESDPAERINLAFLPESREIRTRLYREMLDWQRSVGDPLLEYLESTPR